MNYSAQNMLYFIPTFRTQVKSRLDTALYIMQYIQLSLALFLVLWNIFKNVNNKTQIIKGFHKKFQQNLCKLWLNCKSIF